MREIKFRAWFPKEYYSEPHMAYWDKSEWQTSATWQLSEVHTSGQKDAPIYMQYTGLKDKNGVEIYEGDVVRLRFHEAPDGESFENGEISWHEGSAAFKWYSGDSSDLNNYWLTYADDQFREVIGNRYETPELLGGDRG